MKNSEEKIRDYCIDVYPIGLPREKNKENKNMDENELGKMSGNFYEDVKIVGEVVSRLHGMLEFLEKECIEKDKGKTATDMFIYINDMKNEVSKAVEQSKQLMRASDIDQYGPLSKYIRDYLG